MRKTTLITELSKPKYKKLNVKIMSKDGSCFWYCGKGDTLYSIPAIKEARKHLLAQEQRTINNLTTRLANIDEIYDKMIERTHLESYKKELIRKKRAELVSLPKRIERAKKDLETHLLDRLVVEIFDGITKEEAPCKIILVEGMEKGNFWTIKEYEKRYKEKGELELL